jgi:hypothetical protein
VIGEFFSKECPRVRALSRSWTLLWVTL